MLDYCAVLFLAHATSPSDARGGRALDLSWLTCDGSAPGNDAVCRGLFLGGMVTTRGCCRGSDRVRARSAPPLPSLRALCEFHWSHPRRDRGGEEAFDPALAPRAAAAPVPRAGTTGCARCWPGYTRRRPEHPRPEVRHLAAEFAVDRGRACRRARRQAGAHAAYSAMRSLALAADVLRHRDRARICAGHPVAHRRQMRVLVLSQ